MIPTHHNLKVPAPVLIEKQKEELAFKKSRPFSAHVT